MKTAYFVRLVCALPLLILAFLFPKAGDNSLTLGYAAGILCTGLVVIGELAIINKTEDR